MFELSKAPNWPIKLPGHTTKAEQDKLLHMAGFTASNE